MFGSPIERERCQESQVGKKRGQAFDKHQGEMEKEAVRGREQKKHSTQMDIMCAFFPHSIM